MKKSLLSQSFFAIMLASFFIFILIPALPSLISLCGDLINDLAHQISQVEITLRKWK